MPKLDRADQTKYTASLLLFPGAGVHAMAMTDVSEAEQIMSPEEEDEHHEDFCRARGMPLYYSEQLDELRDKAQKTRPGASGQGGGSSSIFSSMFSAESEATAASVPGTHSSPTMLMLDLLYVMNSAARVAFLCDDERGPELVCQPLSRDGRIRTPLEAVELISLQLRSIERLLMQRRTRREEARETNAIPERRSDNEQDE